MNTIEIIEKKATAYEEGKMMRFDSEVEISLDCDEILLCDYSESRGSAETVEALCNSEDIFVDDIIELCEEKGWVYSGF